MDEPEHTEQPAAQGPDRVDDGFWGRVERRRTGRRGFFWFVLAVVAFLYFFRSGGLFTPQ